MDKEWLREIAFDTDDLMVNVMIICVVPEHHLQRIKGQAVSAVIIDCFEGRKGKEEGCLADGHEAKSLGKGGPDAVEEEALERVVVECAEGVGNVKTVMRLVELFVKKLVDVKQAVEEILPGVNDEAGCNRE